MSDQLALLEGYFNQRKKAFLIFDDQLILQYLSEYALDLLEIDENQIGFATLNDIFPPSGKNPQILIDKNYAIDTIYDIHYTTPSGRSKELRINRDSGLLTAKDQAGFLIWIEAKSRDITAVYRRVSSLDPFAQFDWIFEQNEVGFLLLNKEGIIEKYNERMQSYLSEPGEWRGRNVFTFPFLHQHGIAQKVKKCMQTGGKPVAETLKAKYIGSGESGKIKWSILPVNDLKGALVGAVITANFTKN